MKPAQLSIVDQAVAEFSGQLDVLVIVQRKLTAKHGREQATADICALVNDLPPHIVGATLAAAVLRLAELDGE